MIVLIEIGANLGGDGKPGRHGQTDAAHLGQVGSFSSEKVLLRAISVGFNAEVVNVFHRVGCLRLVPLWFWRAGGLIADGICHDSIDFGLAGAFCG